MMICIKIASKSAAISIAFRSPQTNAIGTPVLSVDRRHQGLSGVGGATGRPYPTRIDLVKLQRLRFLFILGKKRGLGKLQNEPPTFEASKSSALQASQKVKSSMLQSESRAFHRGAICQVSLNICSSAHCSAILEKSGAYMRPSHKAVKRGVS